MQFQKSKINILTYNDLYDLQYYTSIVNNYIFV